MRVQVLGVPEKTTKSGALFQPVALYYPSKRLPIEDMMFLRSESEMVPVGEYTLDVEKAIAPDGKNNNKCQLWVRPENLVPAQGSKAAIAAVNAGQASAQRAVV